MGRPRTRTKGDWTTISIKKQTKKEIEHIGNHGDNFDDILNKLIKMIQED